MIHKMQNPDLPWFRFEWHPENRTLYVVRLPDEAATVICEFVTGMEMAQTAVMAFIAGYRAGRSEPELYKGNGPRTYRMQAETITIKGS